MEDIFVLIIRYLLKVIFATGIQLFLLLGPMLILAFIMNFISIRIVKNAMAVFGDKVFVYLFKWLGTPVHELGHALFALLFFHKITGIKLFDPAAADGSYGYVRHSFSRGNLYQETGNFFIGIGPVLMGAGMLFLSAFFLFCINIGQLSHAALSPATMMNISSIKVALIDIATGLGTFTSLVFTGPNSAWWKIILFIYLLFSIGSSITLSPSDIRSALRGFFYFAGILLLFNLVTLWIGNFTTVAMTFVSGYLSGFYFLMILSIVLNLIFLLLILAAKAMKHSRHAQ